MTVSERNSKHFSKTCEKMPKNELGLKNSHMPYFCDFKSQLYLPIHSSITPKLLITDGI